MCNNTQRLLILFRVFLAYKSHLSHLYFYLGDRTPKQKVKLNVTEEKLLNLMLKYNDKTKKCSLVARPIRCNKNVSSPPSRESDSDPEDLEHAEKLRQIKAVIEESGESIT
ncbi:hypothetical protein HID58_077989 [Brassica napus]|uniref:DET1- and DDB1-associated protein 1 n=1 Tax=Brassica napus TaxID=3708 RepID=A0ABQ7YS91_BRANA|nr:hypothetical protein HID58_077989 [Brassica napus]